MADKKSGVAPRVRAEIAEAVNAAGYSIWDVSYYKEGAEMVLEISIDREGGISIDDCSQVTKIVEPIIDRLDPIEEHYCLQVSSAGTVRPLSRDEHIRFALEGGMPVTLGLYLPVDGKKEFTGVITEYDGNILLLECDGTRRSFDKKSITRITAEFEAAEQKEPIENNKENEDEQGTV